MATSATSQFTFLDPPIEDGDLGALGSYRVFSVLGRGGMGFVFRAEDSRLKRVVALKVMNAKIAATPHSRQRFIDEARSMAAVKHDNVVTIYEVSDHGGTPFMAMEMLHGRTLEEHTRKHQKLDYHQIIHYAIEIARGLAAAHSQGIIHRDIKPANIWIEEDRDRVKILDFGLALAQVPFDQLAKRGSVIGTPQYLSPEQARSDPLDNRTDLYSLGVVLYELCTGELPFNAKTVPEKLIMTLVHEPPVVHRVNPQIPEPLGRLIGTLLKKEPRHRPRSAAELERQLEKVASECEAKSDVALTINKLQEQLSRVVVSKPEPFVELAGYDDSAEADNFSANPFDTVPAGLPALATMSAAPTSIQPAATLRAAHRSPIRPHGNSWLSGLPSYWPFAAIGGVAVVMFSVMLGAWLFSPTAADRVAVDATLPDPPSPSPASEVAASVRLPDGPSPATSVEPGASGSERPGSEVLEMGPPALSRGGGNDNGERTKQAAGDENATPHNDPAAVTTLSPSPPLQDQRRPSGRGSKKRTEALGAASTGFVSSGAPSTAGEGLREDPLPSSDAVKRPPPVVMQRVARRTSDGRGADTTVRRGAGNREQLGANISIAILTRGDVDVQHTYLRFDLEEYVKRLPEVGNAELVLYLPGSPPPPGSTVRVYGVPQEYPDNWQESGTRALVWENSISKAGVEDIPLLAEVVLAAEGSTDAIRVRDPRLTAFIATVREEFVTLVLAGGSPNNKPMHFVSREGDPNKSPLLELELMDSSSAKDR